MLVYLALTAVIEIVLTLAFRDRLNAHKKDPNALTYTAYKDYDETLGYYPGKSWYDDKHGRYVSMCRYRWEYKGKTHKAMYTDNPFNQWERYLMDFPEEITITINRKTGKLYKDKGARAVMHKYLLMLATSFALAAIILFVIPTCIVVVWHQLAGMP